MSKFPRLTRCLAVGSIVITFLLLGLATMPTGPQYILSEGTNGDLQVQWDMMKGDPVDVSINETETSIRPMWRTAGTDILVRGSLILGGTEWRDGDRLTIDATGEVVKQSRPQRLKNDLDRLVRRVRAKL